MEAADILNKIFEIKEKIKSKNLPAYSLGTRENNNSLGSILSRSQYLEQIMNDFGEPLWDKNRDED